LVSEDFISVSDAAKDIYNPWIEKLRMFLGADVVGNYSIEDQWDASSGVGSELAAYVNEVSFVV